MFTHKDIQYRSIFVINCIKERHLRVSNGELLLEESDEQQKKTLTKLPFQKILALFVVGHITITTPLIEKCHRHNVALIVVKPSFRPVFYWSNAAEANFLLRQKQHAMNKEDTSIASVLITNKIANQRQLLINTRKKDCLTEEAIKCCETCIEQIPHHQAYASLMGLEGLASKAFFGAYYQDHNWTARRPRTKCDIVNATLDIGYTALFNFVECFVRMFGFDLYVGVFHRLWFKRKSLICDLMEPFRCIIDRAVRTAYNRRQFTEKDFLLVKGEYKLQYDRNAEYAKVFFDALVEYKSEMFKYVQSYYRCFMQGKEADKYPKFEI